MCSSHRSIGLRVVAPNLSIVDDPTARDAGGKALIGGYKIDDEGVPSQRVQVVKDGTLKTLLTSRTPSQKGQTSNGHARRTADGGAFHGSSTNLFVTGKGGVPRKALTQRLLAAARAEGLKYGLVIRRFDDAAITAAPEFSRRELVQMIKRTDQQLPPATAAVGRTPWPGRLPSMDRIWAAVRAGAATTCSAPASSTSTAVWTPTT